MMPLAQASPSPQVLKDWLEVVLYLCGIILAVAGVWKLVTHGASKTEISGQPIDVRQHPGTVTRDEWEQTHGRISRERREIDAEIKRVELAAEKRADRVEAKLDGNTAMTAEMQGEVKHMNQTMNNLSQSLTNFLRDQARDA